MSRSSWLVHCSRRPGCWLPKEISRPWYLAWAGLVYVVATLATLAWIATTAERTEGG